MRPLRVTILAPALVLAAVLAAPGAGATSGESVALGPFERQALKTDFDKRKTYTVTIEGVLVSKQQPSLGKTSCTYDGFYKDCTDGQRTSDNPEDDLTANGQPIYMLTADQKRPEETADHTYVLVLTRADGDITLQADAGESHFSNVDYSGEIHVTVSGAGGSGCDRKDVRFVYRHEGLPGDEKVPAGVKDIRGGGAGRFSVCEDKQTSDVDGTATYTEILGGGEKRSLVLKIRHATYRERDSHEIVVLDVRVRGSSHFPACPKRSAGKVVLQNGAGLGIVLCGRKFRATADETHPVDKLRVDIVAD